MKLYTNVTIIFCIWTISLLTCFYLAFSTMPPSNFFAHDFFRNLANWDGGHFLGIAEFGYSKDYQYAFFPLYPLTIKALTNITGNYLVSALLISLVSSFLALHLLYNLVLLDFNKKIAEKVILALLFFPTSFYFLTAYSEGLFFLLTLATFYFLRKNNLLLATVAVSLASATRLVGLVVVFSYFLEIQTRGFSKKNWFVFLAPLGFIIYGWYLYNRMGDPFYFVTAEKYWQRSLAIPGLSFWESLKQLSSWGFFGVNFNVFLDLLFAIFGLGFAIRSFRFLPPAYSVYSLISLALPIFTPTLSSMPRFILIVFPIFILISLIKNKYFFFSYQIISLMLLATFAALYINGYWVA